MLGQVAGGVGAFREVDVATRIKAAVIPLSYGFGAPLLPAAEQEVSTCPACSS
jgi:hypothetical protein